MKQRYDETKDNVKEGMSENFVDGHGLPNCC